MNPSKQARQSKPGINDPGINDPTQPGPMSVRLDKRQQIFAGSVVLAVAGTFVQLWGPNLGRFAASGRTGTTFLVMGLVLSAVALAAVATKRRVLAALGMLLLAMGPWNPPIGSAANPYHFIQILLFAFAGWQMFQVARELRTRRSASSAVQPRRAAGFLKGILSPAKASTAASQPGHPQPSKRYTPPGR